jgi:hypothetical protein
MDHRIGKPATNRLSYGTTITYLILPQILCKTFCFKMTVQWWWMILRLFTKDLLLESSRCVKHESWIWVLTAVTMNIFFWVLTPCSPAEFHRHFGGMNCLPFHGRRLSQARNQQEVRSNLRKNTKISVRFSGIAAEIRRAHLRNASPKRYRYTNLLGPFPINYLLLIQWFNVRKRSQINRKLLKFLNISFLSRDPGYNAWNRTVFTANDKNIDSSREGTWRA